MKPSGIEKSHLLRLSHALGSRFMFDIMCYFAKINYHTRLIMEEEQRHKIICHHIVCICLVTDEIVLSVLYFLNLIITGQLGDRLANSLSLALFSRYSGLESGP